MHLYVSVPPPNALGQHGQFEIAPLLLQHGADVNLRGSSNQTPLIHAAKVRSIMGDSQRDPISPRSTHPPPTQKGNVELVSLFLNAGADVSVSSTPFGTAREAAHDSDVVDAIDAHLRRRLRAQLVDLACALHALHLPVLLILNIFTFRSVLTYAGEHVSLALDLQWSIVKHIR